MSLEELIGFVVLDVLFGGLALGAAYILVSVVDRLPIHERFSFAVAWATLGVSAASIGYTLRSLFSG